MEYKFNEKITILGYIILEIMTIFILMAAFSQLYKFSTGVPLIVDVFTNGIKLIDPAFFCKFILLMALFCYLMGIPYLIGLLICINRDNCKSIIVEKERLILNTSKNKQIDLPLCNLAQVTISSGRNPFSHSRIYGAMYLFHIKIITNDEKIYRVTLSKYYRAIGEYDEKSLLRNFTDILIKKLRIPASTAKKIQLDKKYNLRWHKE